MRIRIFVDLLPFALQGQERADFEKARRNVYSLGELAPVAEVANFLSVIGAVVDNEKLAADLVA